MRVAVIGGGINGICTAWQLAEAGHEVVLFERNRLMGATSSASTKLLHGGLRYLEHGEVRLVREALQERAWWIAHAPHLCAAVSIGLPVYRQGRRSRWRYKAGLWMYDRLAGSRGLGKHRWVSVEELVTKHPRLRRDGLRGAYFFTDGQMDDYQLGLWAAAQARSAGVDIKEQQIVLKVNPNGSICCQGATEQVFDHLVNVAGPWAGELLNVSGVSTDVQLDLVRGSHIYMECKAPGAFLLEHPADGRMFFVLPYQQGTLIGTTEVRQPPTHEPICSEEEKAYLLAGYNAFFTDEKSASDVASAFAGMRPLLRTSSNPTRMSREYAIETRGKLTTVFGGKWTTARALARRVVSTIEATRSAASSSLPILSRNLA